VVVPVRIEDVKPSGDLEYFLGTPHWLDAITPPFERHLDYIADSAKFLIERIRSNSPRSSDLTLPPALSLHPVRDEPSVAPTAAAAAVVVPARSRPKRIIPVAALVIALIGTAAFFGARYYSAQQATARELATSAQQQRDHEAEQERQRAMADAETRKRTAAEQAQKDAERKAAQTQKVRAAAEAEADKRAAAAQARKDAEQKAAQAEEAHRLAMVDELRAKPLQLRDIQFLNTTKTGAHLSAPTTSFDVATVLFVGWEITFDNRLFGVESTNHRIDAVYTGPDGRKLGSLNDFQVVSKNMKSVTFTGRVGNSAGGAFLPGTYTVDFLLDAQPIGTKKFDVEVKLK
jgi:hypothetical protein